MLQPEPRQRREINLLPKAWQRIPRIPRNLMTWGVLAAVAGYVTLNTQLVLAYKAGTLANAHTICSNAFLVGTSKITAQRCSAINGWYTLATVALWGGLALAAIGLVLYLAQRRDKP